MFEDENEGYFNITINWFQELRAFSDMASIEAVRAFFSLQIF